MKIPRHLAWLLKCVLMCTVVSLIGSGTAHAQVTLGDAVTVWAMEGDPDGVPDLNGNESPLGRIGDISFNTDVSGAGITATNANQLALSEGPANGFVFVVPDPAASSELRVAARGSMTLFARVRHASYNGIDDAFRMGNIFFTECDTYALELDDGAPRFVVGLPQLPGEPCEELSLTSSPLNAGSFYDITGVFDAGEPDQADGTLTVYVYDPATGEEVHPPAILDGLEIEELFEYTGTNFLFLEAPGNANGTNDGGQIELAAVWDQALSATDVAALSAGASVHEVPATSTFGLVALCLLLASAGTLALRRKVAPVEI